MVIVLSAKEFHGKDVLTNFKAGLTNFVKGQAPEQKVNALMCT